MSRTCLVGRKCGTRNLWDSLICYCQRWHMTAGCSTEFLYSRLSGEALGWSHRPTKLHSLPVAISWATMAQYVGLVHLLMLIQQYEKQSTYMPTDKSHHILVTTAARLKCFGSSHTSRLCFGIVNSRNIKAYFRGATHVSFGVKKEVENYNFKS